MLCDQFHHVDRVGSLDCLVITVKLLSGLACLLELLGKLFPEMQQLNEVNPGQHIKCAQRGVRNDAHRVWHQLLVQ
jgi:hypothetical protein